MRVLSLFDGMACGLLALKRAGIPVTEYHAFEIDKHAIQVAKANHPEIIHHGEITFMTDFTQFKGFDLLIGGSPCQGFSFAGKQLNFSDPRSQLFFEFVRAKREAKPKYFMLENVKMKKEHLAVISEHLGAEPVFINSALVSAQNRQRYYWANWDINQPEDKGIALNDILDDGFWSNRSKSYCLDAMYGKGTNFRRYFFCGSRQLVLEYGYSPTGLTKETANKIMHEDGNRWRLLSVTEAEKLQNVPLRYVDSAGIPKVEKYKVLGNGWTVDVIAHIFRCMTGRTTCADSLC